MTLKTALVILPGVLAGVAVPSIVTIRLAYDALEILIGCNSRRSVAAAGVEVVMVEAVMMIIMAICNYHKGNNEN
jgi:hypothetical protein